MSSEYAKTYYQKNKEKIKARSKAWSANNPGKSALYTKKWLESNPVVNKLNKRKNKLKKYGLTLEQYDSMLVNQNYRCKICNKHSSQERNSLVVDHCHIENKVRGLLCSQCNVVLGLFDDNAFRFQMALDYLKDTGTPYSNLVFE